MTFQVRNILFDGQDCKLVTMKDVSTQLKLRKAKNKTKTMKTLQSSVSHNIKSPLSSISMLAQALFRKIHSLTPEVESIIRTIFSASRLSSFLVQDLLDNQMIENGQFRIQFSPIFLRLEIEELFGILRPQADQLHNRFCLEMEEPFPQTVVVDKNRVNQVLLNLLVNANKFTSNGKITVSCCFLDSYIIFEVKDEGIGIREEDKAKLFDAFQQFDHGRDRNPNGTGLGLSICKRILNEMGTSIKLQHTATIGPERGSTFVFTVKCQEPR